MVAPSSQQIADNLKRHAEGMADEIARRCAETSEFHLTPATVRQHALAVMLDWYLGDFLPGRPDEKT
jgi:hypothetical protein